MSLEGLLNELGCTHVQTKHDARGPKLTATCPMHADHSPSFMIRPEHPYVFNCFKCGKGARLENLVNRSMRYLGTSGFAARDIVQKHVDLSRVVLQEAFQSHDYTLDPLNPNELFAYAKYAKKARDYCVTRHITRTTSREHVVGYDRAAKRVMVPIFNHEHQLMAFIGRSIKKKPKQRYMIYGKRPREKLMLGAQHYQNTQDVYVVEGAIKYLYMRQCGYENTVCILGSHASPWHIDYLTSCTGRIIMLLDNDVAGANGTLDFINTTKATNVYVPCYLESDGDLDELSVPRLKELISTVTPPYATKMAKIL